VESYFQRKTLIYSAETKKDPSCISTLSIRKIRGWIDAGFSASVFEHVNNIPERHSFHDIRQFDTLLKEESYEKT
jgi:hypothetical protein